MSWEQVRIVGFVLLLAIVVHASARVFWLAM